ncbi:hypothetical protein BUALT_Bualt03G0128400 [Buddleja alternifolia]|uniref:B box-type domain-containing protein n=1 Tax=Buddleja alternifolia TaxID=168488 RepID=A0AAV6XT89_9LAMI|nr:hypothetical protein BUALT_Bualt03G0128400 [Buddleja alternifolia]
MSKKACELCSNPATMFCESDQASLCWDCDEKVHAANFLVAKHSRTLLCHLCHSPTPWKAAGTKLRPTVSVCHACADHREIRGSSSGNRREDEEESDSQESESDDGEYNSDSDDEDEEEDGENQVVPWSISSSKPPSPSATTAASSSDSEEDFSKRIRDYTFDSEDEDACSSSQNRSSELGSSRINFRESDTNYRSPSVLSLLRPLKMRRTSNSNASIPTVQRGGGQTPATSSEAAAAATKEGDSPAITLGLCKLAGDS